MTYLPNQGMAPDGTTSLIRKDGIAAQTTAPLGANLSYTTGWIDTKDFKEIYAVVFADQLSASPAGIVIEYSNDGTTIIDSASRPYTVVNDFSRSSFPVTTKYIRYTYNNGTTAQTKFLLSVSLLTIPLGSSKTSLANTVNDLTLAESTRAVLEVKDSGGTYGKITRTGTALDVNVANPGGGTDVSALAKETTLGNINTNTGNQADAAASTPASNGSVISVLKAIFGRMFPASSATVTTQTTLATVTTVLAANPNRKGAKFTSVTGTILIKYGTGASATSYTERLVTNASHELPGPTVYSGVITAIGAGTLNVTEW